MKSLTHKYCQFFNISIYDTKNKDIIKNKYKQLAKKYHPDSGGSEDDFKYLNTAYEYLLNYSFDNNKDIDSVNIKDNLNIVIELELSLESLFNGFEHKVEYNRYIKDIGTLDIQSTINTLYIHSKKINKQGYLLYRNIGHQYGNAIGHYIIIPKLLDNYKIIADGIKNPALYKELTVTPNSKYTININNEDIVIDTPELIKNKHFITINNKGLILSDDSRGALILKLRT